MYMCLIVYLYLTVIVRYFKNCYQFLEESVQVNACKRSLKRERLSVTNYQNTFLHPAVKMDIKLFLDKPIECKAQRINEATNEIHKIFNKITKPSLQKNYNIKLQSTKMVKV